MMMMMKKKCNRKGKVKRKEVGSTECGQREEMA